MTLASSFLYLLSVSSELEVNCLSATEYDLHFRKYFEYLTEIPDCDIKAVTVKRKIFGRKARNMFMVHTCPTF